MPLLVLIAISAVVFFLIFRLTIGSIEHLGTKIGEFYPFEIRVEKPNTWTTIFFLTVVTILTLIIFFLAKGGIPKLPA